LPLWLHHQILVFFNKKHHTEAVSDNQHILSNYLIHSKNGSSSPNLNISEIPQVEYSSTLAASTLIILFSEMLKSSVKNFFSKKNKIVYEIRESFEKILFFNMEFSKLIK